MFKSTLIIVITLILIYFSVKIKTKKMARGKRKIDLPDETKSSPVSKALAELVAVAGGIYLSLIMLVSFLDLTVAEQINLLGYKFEPLAALSIIIALIQPWIAYLLEKFKK